MAQTKQQIMVNDYLKGNSKLDELQPNFKQQRSQGQTQSQNPLSPLKQIK